MGSPNLSPPPKFGPSQVVQPVSQEDWQAFTRWLFSLFQTTQQSVNAGQVQGIGPLAQLPRPSDADILTWINDGGAPASPDQTAQVEAVTSIDSVSQQPAIDALNALQAVGDTAISYTQRIDDVEKLLWNIIEGNAAGTSAKLTGTLIVDTFANLSLYPAASNPNGLFFASNLKVFYVVVGTAWVFGAGVYNDVFANRPAGLGANDKGFYFHQTDSPQFSYLWSGTAWVSESELGTTIRGTHSTRTSTPPGSFAAGVRFFETDRALSYINDTVHWIYESGAILDTAANQATYAATLAAADTGVLYITTDTLALYYWTGTAFALVGSIGGGPTILADTHAHRIASFPATSYPLDTLFYETDRHVIYVNQLISGVQQWIFGTGTYNDTFASRPTGFSSLDSQFRFHSQDSDGQSFLWNGAAWINTTEVGLTLLGTRATRLGVSPSSYAIGVTWYETDTALTYIVNGSSQWQYQTGVYVNNSFALSLGALDAGLLWLAPGTGLLEYWNGSTFLPVVPDPHPNAVISTVAGRKVVGGSGNFVSGSASVVTGLSAVIAFTAIVLTGPPAAEVVGLVSNVAGTIGICSSVVGSSSLYTWIAFGL